MPHIKCLAQGLRVVVMVMLFPAASTTTLPTPSHHAPPSSPVPGPLLWSIWPDLLSPLQALGSTAVCTSLDALSTTATPHISVASGLSSQSETPSSTPMLSNFTVGKWVQRGQSPPPRPDIQQIGFLDGCGTEAFHCFFWEARVRIPQCTAGPGPGQHHLQ